MKKILQESKETVGESDVRSRMQPLKDMLIETINHLHTVLETHVFIATCRGYWDRMGQVSFLTQDLIDKAHFSFIVSHIIGCFSFVTGHFKFLGEQEGK